MTDHGLVLRAFGAPPDALALEPVTDGDGVRVRLLAMPVLPMDRLQLRGLYPWPMVLPAVAGAAGCGVIEGGPHDGQRVLLPIRAGTWRTGGRWPLTALAPIPADADPLQAAGLVVNGLTADDLLAGLRAGDTVVQSPGGAVGRLVDQLCTQRGIRCVTWLRAASPGWQEATLAPPAGLGAARALDGVGGEATEALGGCVGDGGAVVHYGAMSRGAPRLAVADVIFRGVRLEGYWLRRSPASPAERRDRLTALAGLGLRVPYDAVFPLSRWREALARAGRIALVPDGSPLVTCGP